MKITLKELTMDGSGNFCTEASQLRIKPGAAWPTTIEVWNDGQQLFASMDYRDLIHTSSFEGRRYWNTEDVTITIFND